jgi:triosephosphate isomerase
MRVIALLVLSCLASALRVPSKTSTNTGMDPLIQALKKMQTQMPQMPRTRTKMMAHSRVPLIAGNWKMNTVLSSAVLLAHDLAKLTAEIDSKKVEVAVFVPYPFLRDVSKSLQQSNIKVGAQNVYFEDKGAYTAAVSGSMLKSVDCTYVLVGHSERRAVFGETDSEVNKNLKSVLAGGMKPILCVGETLEEYELGLTEMVCNVQIRRGLADLTPAQVSKTVIAYEPVWAIGTGKVATPAIAQSVHAHIRAQILKLYGER